MIEINILNKGDSVIAINEQFLAIKRKSGEIDIYRVMFNAEGEFSIDPVKAAVIGFGDGVVSKKLDDGDTTVFTF